MSADTSKPLFFTRNTQISNCIFPYDLYCENQKPEKSADFSGF
ncbi:hypothetical protein HMPREF9436_01256 [Faecalibacterium cf. prausnitzii KLE1255]|uniref:Uncharacterized protein n=1 Tax=Faecalibacterium cf. prausnitzii KLE1255 TaxID=748224 RepID=E2ZHW6_9FIRM|nr:hypothetical protein HMPREF9436_01256 [Faecalibacterium cf. prausnitzii KLE1255]